MQEVFGTGLQALRRSGLPQLRGEVVAGREDLLSSHMGALKGHPSQGLRCGRAIIALRPSGAAALTFWPKTQKVTRKFGKSDIQDATNSFRKVTKKLQKR